MELLTPGTGLIIWQLIIFVLLFLLLSKLAWKPILSSLKEREKSIQDALDTAENTRAEIAKLKADNANLLREARDERDKMLRDAREAGNRLKEEAQIAAKKSADKIIEDARAAINIEKQAAMKDIRIQVSNFSLEIAEKLLKKNLSDDSSQKALVDSYLKDLKIN
ncbi:F-type H+-transporting ATPase subunit b [Chryseolinea serpens]|uniref:ATP synthase subunit b n=1 Tax=Chryseolinea serpens TaxID=947013 RepID=A0A1M5NVL7_9BACT|nr:F0F1 ATP synthase subunit B [Chryseolinea serpens]SHG93537.1 F-type H+-transporting ATPase subunit b [Chryseolinea serpens]